MISIQPFSINLCRGTIDIRVIRKNLFLFTFAFQNETNPKMGELKDFSKVDKGIIEQSVSMRGFLV